MRKRLLFVSLSVPLLLSCSLKGNYSSWYSGYFRAGEFIGKHEYFDGDEPQEFVDGEAAIFFVENISKDEFDKANGVDVVEDYNGGKNPFFRLSLQVRFKPDENYSKYHFYNLKRHPNKILEYKDDYWSMITPGSKSFDDQKNGSTYTYRITWCSKENEATKQFNIIFPMKKGA